MATHDLYGNAPDHAHTALLLIDLINDFDFPGGEALLEHTRRVVPNVVRLRDRCREAGVPVIHVNDNFGRWRSDFSAVLRHCLSPDARGCDLIAPLRPGEEDYFVLKAKHSGFFHTTLELLLEHLGARRLVLTGIAGNNCVLFTANDAYLRDYRLIVPRDCTASIRDEDNTYALKQMAEVLKADTSASDTIDLMACGAGESSRVEP